MSVECKATARFPSLYKRIPLVECYRHWPVLLGEPTTCSHSVISFAYQGHQFRVYEGKASKRLLVHGVNKHLLTMGQSRLLIQELSVKVAAVAGGFLGGKGPDLQSDHD